MKSLYTKEATNVPTSLTKSSSKFKQKVALAILGLGLFAFLYIGLMCWFGHTSFQQFSSLGGYNDNRIKTVLVGIISGFLAVFMFKSLLIFNKKDKSKLKTLTKESEPVLFDFIYQLADEAGAPRPHKVIITPNVNASVFYDLSILNLLFPSRKNLNIGLGLVNVVNLGEFKAILAHEFGHFAQKSMLLGRYVYIAHQIAARIVNKRDAFDAFLKGISSIDIRIAWIGWILSILVWAVRSLIEVLFSIVIVAERALSREMEFQADLVAVSLTGSDSLINGLHKLKGADEAYNASLGIIDKLLREDKKIPDLYALQSFYIKRMQTILNDPSFGATPLNFKEGIQSKIFESNGVTPPEMWATHPADEDREENAKRKYIPSKIDTRSTWELFANTTVYKKEITAELYNNIENLQETTMITLEESCAKMNKEIFDWTFLTPAYKGLYLSRMVTLSVENESEFYQVEISENFQEEYKNLYPESLKISLEKLKQLQLEEALLNAVKNEVLTAERREIFFRGKKIKRKEIKLILLQLKKEITTVETSLDLHDNKIRTLNYKVASIISPEKAKFHKEILKMLHYCEHTSAHLDNLILKFNNKLQTASAGGRANNDQMYQLTLTANQLGKTIETVFEAASEVKEKGLLSDSFNKKAYKDLFEPCKLGKATSENINQWISFLDGWFSLAKENLWKLRNSALERLLQFEKEIETAYLNKEKLELVTTVIQSPEKYNIYKKEDAYKWELKLSLWDRFMAGYGLIPLIAKFIIAAILISIVFLFSNYSSTINLYLYNGFERDVIVEIEDEQFFIPALDHVSTELVYNTDYKFVTKTINGECIEKFTTRCDQKAENYLYNIANSGYFYEFTVNYGNNLPFKDNYIGSKRWFASYADYIFEDAPNTVYTKNHYETRKVLQVLTNVNPNNYPIEASEENAMQRALNHATWDGINSKFLLSWFDLAVSYDSTLSFAYSRLELNKDETSVLRLLQNNYGEKERQELCDDLNEKYSTSPQNSDLYYLTCRCIEDETLQTQKFAEGNKKWKDNSWLSYANAYALANQEKWQEAYDLFAMVASNNKALLDYFAFDFERIRRVVYPLLNEPGYKEELGDIQKINYLRLLEWGDNALMEEGFQNHFYHLSQGDLIKAEYYFNEANENNNFSFLYFLACSEGAVEKQITRVLNWDDEKGINFTTIWMAIGLRIKHNISCDELITSIHNYWGESIQKDLIEFKNALVKKDITTCKKIIKSKRIFAQKHTLL